MSLPKPNKLSQMTRTAIKQGQQQADAEAARQQAEAERRQKADELAAESVLIRVAGLAEEAATGRQKTCKVYRMSGSDYELPPESGSPVKLNPKYLRRVAKLVYDQLLNADLKPTIVSWDDGVGMSGGYDIYINWN